MDIYDQYGLNFNLYPKQRLLLAHPDDTKDIPGYVTPKEVLFGGAAGASKAQPLSFLVCTPFGFKPLGSLEPGSLVSNPDGSISKIIQIHILGEQDIYKVSFSDGTSTECTIDHLWEVRFTGYKDTTDSKLLDTRELITFFEKQKLVDEKTYPVIPLTRPVKFSISDIDIPIEPYALGTSLGKASDYKYIPKSYLYAPIKDRQALLQGLMDTDKHVSCDKKLAQDIKFLVQSLGGLCVITEIKNDVYTCDIQLTNATEDNSPLGRTMVGVKWVRKEEARCITVDNPNGLYLTNDFIVTHNSFALRAISIILAVECPGVQVYLFRKTFTDLDQNHMNGPNGYRSWLSAAVENKMVKIDSAHHEIYFKNGPNGGYAGGSMIYLRHVQHDKDVFKYQGAEIHVLIIDEATHFSSDIYTYLRGRVRLGTWSPPEKWAGYFPRILLGSNPGNMCLDEGRVLTTNGWKDIRDMVIGDEVYSVNPYTLETQIKQVTNTIKEKCTGPLVHIKNKKLDITCTVNHKLSYVQGGKIELTPFYQLPTSANVLTNYPEYKIEKFNKDTDVKYKAFNDYVYCIEVEDNHNFIVEQHQKVWVSGNSHLYFKNNFVDFVDKGNPYKPKYAPPDDGGMLRQYIPGTVYDNPLLLEQDPTYIDRLKGLGSEELVDALLNGNWDIVAGGMFDDVWDSHYIIMPPFEIPDNWYLNRGFDWGSAAPFATLWFAESNGEEVTLADGTVTSFPSGTLFVVEELYGNNPNGKDLDKGIMLSNVEIGYRIHDKELNSPVLRDVSHRILQGPADNQIFNVMNNDTIARGINAGYWGSDKMNNIDIFFRSDKSPGSRIKRWSLMRDRFKAVLKLKDGEPMENQGLIIFSNCTNTIRTLPTLSRKDTDPEDIADGQPDHIADVVGYRCLQKGGAVNKVKVKLGV